MPGGLPLGFEICNMPSGYGININNSNITSGAVTPSATANTKGAWKQLTAATDNDACMIVVMIENDNGGPSNYSVDIGVGAAGSEVVLVADLMTSNNNGVGGVGVYYMLPVQIPSGTRVAVRTQCSLAAQGAVDVAVYIGDGAFTQLEGAAGVATIGFVSATTFGTTVTSGNAVKGAYAQLSASTPRDYVGLMFAMDYQDSAVGNNNSWLADIAIGAGGSEKIIIPNYYMRTNTQGIFNPPSSQYFPIQIPSGSAVSARLQNSGAAVAVGVTAYGVYY